MTRIILAYLFLLALPLRGGGARWYDLRVALPYAGPSLELLPLYLAMETRAFAEQGLDLQLLYAGTSRQALELLSLKQADVALSDSAVFVYLAGQQNYLLGFLQYFQRSPFVALVPDGHSSEDLVLEEEDAILSTIIYLDRRVRAPNLALFQRGGEGWSYRTFPCSFDASPLFIDKKLKGKVAETLPRCDERPTRALRAAVVRRVSLSSPRAAGWETRELADAEILPGFLWVSRGETLLSDAPRLRLFARALLRSMTSFVRYPEQGANRGLTALGQEFSATELSRLLPVLQRLPWLLQGGAGGKRIKIGDLSEERYRALVARMERLGVIERGLSSRDLIASERFPLPR